jgi:hypothetical protein
MKRSQRSLLGNDRRISPRQNPSLTISPFALVNGGALPEPTYKAAVREFGNKGANELSYFVGVYRLVSITLNTFDIQVID